MPPIFLYLLLSLFVCPSRRHIEPQMSVSLHGAHIGCCAFHTLITTPLLWPFVAFASGWDLESSPLGINTEQSVASSGGEPACLISAKCYIYTHNALKTGRA